MRPHALVYFYVRRLRTHPIQELLAGLGIAIGVALAFAVMVANSSVVASATDMVDGVTGTAQLQIASRDTKGFDQKMLARVRRIDGVTHAAPALERRAVLLGPSGANAAVNLVSVDRSLAQLAGQLTRSFLPGGLELRANAIVLPQAVADEIRLARPRAQDGAQQLPRVTVHVRGRQRSVTVAAVLGQDALGPLRNAQVAVMQLASLQRLISMPDTITRVLVTANRSHLQEVEARLKRLAGGRLAVTDTNNDITLLKQATEPTDQVTGFFAAVSAVLGLLLAFNAMLLTAPERRRLVSGLRIQGYRRHQVVAILLFQALALGAIASIAGVLAGNLLSRTIFNDTPEYLAPGFTLGGGTVVTGWPLLVALAGGIAMSCVASAPPLFDLRRRRAIDAVLNEPGAPGNSLHPRTANRALVASVVAFIAATVVLVAMPAFALLASALLAVATLLAIPATFKAVTAVLAALVNRFPRLSMLSVALMAMRATTLRSLALAATGAVAVFGSVAIGGARHDLLAGIGGYAADYVGTADFWIVNPADNQAINDFQVPALAKRIAATPGVASVRRYQGSFLDMGSRRVWVIARPPHDREMLPPTSLVDGDLQAATRALRRTGNIAVSHQIAQDKGLELGDSIDVPTPAGWRRFRIVATTTNLGWAPGALILNTRDYRREWRTQQPTALEVDLVDGHKADTAAAAIAHTVARDAPGLRTLSANARAAIINTSARQGLKRLDQINLLLQIAAVLAMATAMGAAIWQRRPSLAALRIQSFTPRQLWILLLIEASAVLGTGGLAGAIGGTYGRFGADRFLQAVTGFPVAPTALGLNTVITFIAVVATALTIIAVPGWFAARAPARLGLGAE